MIPVIAPSIKPLPWEWDKRLEAKVFIVRMGLVFPVEYRAQPFYQNGILKGAVCTFLDITEILKTEEQLHKARGEVTDASARIGIALDAGMILGTFVWDIQADRIKGDGRFAKLFSIEPSVMDKGVPLEELFQEIHPDDIERVDGLIKKTLEEGGFYDAEYRVNQGDEWHWIHASGKVDP